MRFQRLQNPMPFLEAGEMEKAIISGSNDFYGANSLEHFSSASGLTYTHEDAQGFLDYPTSFPGKAANFWLKDAGVKVWEYEETYDNWQDTYGMDSVMVFYHSGHGNMDSNGVFQAPLGSQWDNRDWAYSTNMAFANEELRYLFWSTCYSLRVSGPDNPVRTWWAPNRGGLRMMFGYETTSVDDPNYGKYFWEEWKKGKTFAQAFLDASWRISHNQVPVVMAVGSNQADAINRLNNERLFTKSPISKGWYQWQWIGTLPTRSLSYRSSAPKNLNALMLDKNMFDDERIVQLANEVGISARKAGLIQFDETGNRMIADKKIILNVNRDGALNIHLGKANIDNTTMIEEANAVKIAKRMVDDLGFSKGIELEQGHIRHRMSSGGTMKGSGTLKEPVVNETIVQFRQCYKGVSSVNSDHGLITVSVDNDGKVTNIYNSTRRILGEADRPRSIIQSPPDKGKASQSATEEQFKKAIHGIINRSANSQKEVKSDSRTLIERVGYDFSDKLGLVVRQRDVEVTIGANLRKRYKVRLRVMG